MKSSTQFVKGTLILAFANLLCRFLGFFYKIFLAQALGAEGMGIYQLIFPVLPLPGRKMAHPFCTQESPSLLPPPF